MAVGQNPVPLVNINIGGKLMFIHPKMEPYIIPHGQMISLLKLPHLVVPLFPVENHLDPQAHNEKLEAATQFRASLPA